eukprot:13539588-Ditylum_brightwellii.AAC.1
MSLVPHGNGDTESLVTMSIGHCKEMEGDNNARITYIVSLVTYQICNTTVYYIQHQEIYGYDGGQG